MHNICLFFCTAILSASGLAAPIRSAAELSVLNRGGAISETNFNLTATVIRTGSASDPEGLYVADASGATSLHLSRHQSLAVGDMLRLSGTIARRQRHTEIVVTDLEHLGHETPPETQEISVADAHSGQYDFRLVRVTALVQDAFNDETNAKYSFLVLMQGGEMIYAAIPFTDGAQEADNRALIGSVVSVTGICDAYRHFNRPHKGRELNVATRNDIVLRSPASQDMYEALDISTLNLVPPARMHTFGRLKAQGSIIATWRNNTFLLRLDNGEISRIETAVDGLPKLRDRVEAVGFPETDLYSINLSRARWRKTGECPCREPPPRDIRAQALFTDEDGVPGMNPVFHGQGIRLSGLVRSLPGTGNDSDILYIESDGHIVNVDLSACRSIPEGVEIGCRVSVSGVCVMNVDRFRPNAAFPRIRGFTLVMRTTDRIDVLARPSWWTPARIWSAFGGLITILLGALLWNASLRRLAERRGRELFKRQYAQAKSELKVEERTRLAVELHDSLSQTLTGVSMEIAAADDLRGNASREMTTHLERAGRTLKSCRDELRNCLWDLRSEALDEPDVNRAILKTLQPHIDGTKLSVRFNVPRERISDNTTHALLRMIRELVVNALRHGEATSVKVAGSLDADALHFSIRDNGKGFDLDDYPGVLQGHFGLQGVRERLEKLGGALTIDSAPGRGTHITGRIPVHSPTPAGV